MAFKEAGSTGHKPENTGLPKNWDRLEDQECPICADELVYFNHLDMWKCACGFKISDTRMREIVKSIDERDTYCSQGWRVGDWYDEGPF